MRITSIIFSFLVAVSSAILPQVTFAQDTSAQKPMKDLSGPPDATASFEAKQLRLIFGGAEGKGVLHYKGKDYPFTMTGVTVGGVGYTEVEGTAEVRFLKKIEDFPGTYNGIGAGGAVGSSAGASSFQSLKEVVITTKSKGKGLALNLGVSSVTIKLAN